MSTSPASQVRFERPSEGIARIVLARPEARNAQGMQMTYELNAAFDRAAHDDTVKVIILSADGPHFSAGHDLAGDHGKTWRDFPIVGTWADFDAGGAAGRYYREKEIYLEMGERWRNIPKPTIAAIQGKCVSGALLLAWVCDIIVAADDAQFRDTTTDLGLTGVEMFMHPYELGTRKAKEWLFTSGWLTASEAEVRGMVNRVVRADDLQTETLALAQTIAQRPAFALRTVKEACNQAQDLMGRRQVALSAFALHHLAHAHNQLKHGMHLDPFGIPPTAREKFFERMGKPDPERGGKPDVEGTEADAK
jgi:enoyl-CoA hydratase